ncbi:MAG: 2OG-Fe(II) oxygenase [Frankiales bacterium]|nr:2OG-Fe(II) oxygenase [Frankiales bacterium]
MSSAVRVPRPLVTLAAAAAVAPAAQDGSGPTSTAPAGAGATTAVASSAVSVDAVAVTALAEELRDAFRSARPYPHLVLEGLVADDLLAAVVAELEAPRETTLTTTHSRRIVKHETPDVSALGPCTRALADALDGPAVLAALSVLTGIPDLLPDPDRFGAGFHETPPGGYQKVHTDFRRHPVTRLHHRVNLLLYLNADWPDSYGGALELWPPDMSALGRRVAPTLGTVVVFETNAHTPHGLPDPVACPPDRARRSLAVYAYSRSRPAWERSGGAVGTYRSRPGESALVGLPTAKEAVLGLVPERVRQLLRGGA